MGVSNRIAFPNIETIHSIVVHRTLWANEMLAFGAIIEKVNRFGARIPKP